VWRIWRGQVATLDDLRAKRLCISSVSHEEALERAPQCAKPVASTMGWSSAEQEQQVQLHGARLARFLIPSGVAA
jgi:hypothetical protein